MSLDFGITFKMNNGDVISPSVERLFDSLFNIRGPAYKVMVRLRIEKDCFYNDETHEPTTLIIHNNVNIESKVSKILSEALSDYNVDIQNYLSKMFEEFIPSDINTAILEVV